MSQPYYYGQPQNQPGGAFGGQQPYPNQTPYPAQGVPAAQPYYPQGQPYPQQPAMAVQGQQQPMYASPTKPPAGAVAVSIPQSDRDTHHSSPSDYTGYLSSANSEVRKGFIRKVYMILSAQLLVTFLISLAIYSIDSVREEVQNSPGYLYVALIVSFGFLIALACFPSVARTYPKNYICLAGFTLAESYLVGVITSFYDADVVLQALVGTVLITASLTLYATQTKTDFTTKGGMLLVILIGLIFIGILSAIFRSEFLYRVYAGLGIIVFGLFIVYDTQLIVGGKNRTVQLSVDDYVFGALTLYIDIVQLFLFLLRFLNSNNN